MYSSTAPEADIQETGGEPLEGSGFEAENPAIGFEVYLDSAEEGFGQ